MHFIIDTAKVVEVFCFIDDFCKEVAAYFASHPLSKGLSLRHRAGRRPSLSESEVLTILVLYTSPASSALSTTTSVWCSGS